MPTRARLFLQYFVSSFVVWVCCGGRAHRDCAVTGREDAVHFGGEKVFSGDSRGSAIFDMVSGFCRDW